MATKKDIKDGIELFFSQFKYTAADGTTYLKIDAAINALEDINVSKIAGTTVDVNSGAKSNGTQRFVIATDQPAFSVAGLMSVKFDRTTPGTTNSVATIQGQDGVAGGSGVVGPTTQRMVLAIDVALPSGTNILGKVGIDQTTPGTTNLVQANGNDIDNAAITTNKPLISGGQAVDITTYAPAYTVGDAVTLSFNKLTGGLLVQNANLGYITDSVTAYRGNSIAQTYRSTGFALTAATSATDLMILSGSASKTIRVKRIKISGSHATGLTTPIKILLRNVANSSGTPTVQTIVPLDSNNAVATAVATSYAGVPTTGGLIGNIDTFLISLALVTGTNSAPLLIEFGKEGVQEVILRGVAQSICVNLNAATTAGTFYITFEWTEE